jgi:DNA-binding response OmpR family regulator
MSNFEQNRGKPVYISDKHGWQRHSPLHTPGPCSTDLLREHGYELITATTGRDGLRLFTSRAVDAVVLEYHLGLLDGAVIASEIKQVRPTIPIVMLADHLELPNTALKSVDALVTKSDGAQFLLATVHSVLKGKPTQGSKGKLGTPVPGRPQPLGRFAGQAHNFPAEASPGPQDAPFSAEEWRKIRTGTVRF